MTGMETRAEITALWRRLRMAPRQGASAPPPDPLRLAAYAEHRLDETEAQEIELWLAENPQAIEDIEAARSTLDRPVAAPAAAIERVLASVPARDPKVIAFSRPGLRSSGLRLALAWSGLAASIAATGLVGFVLGSDAYSSFIVGDQQAQVSALDQEFFAPPASLFADPGEESAI